MHPEQRKIKAYRRFFSRYTDSELSVSRFCSKEKVSTNTFYYRRKRLRELEADHWQQLHKDDNSPAPFLPVAVEHISDPMYRGSSPFEIRFPNALQLIVPCDFDPQKTERLIGFCAGVR
jgi:hypothetical protein